jgi:hypothetical protein
MEITMKPLKLIATTLLYGACLCAAMHATADPTASVLSSAAIAARPGGLAVTPNLRIYGNKPPLPRPGNKVTPPDKPPVVSSVSPGMSDKDKDDSEAGHGQTSGKNLRSFTRADGSFLRQ